MSPDDGRRTGGPIAKAKAACINFALIGTSALCFDNLIVVFSDCQHLSISVDWTIIHIISMPANSRFQVSRHFLLWYVQEDV